MFLVWSIRALLLGTLVLFPWLGRPRSHVLSRLAHVPLRTVDLPPGASSAFAECGVVALAEIRRRAFLMSLLLTAGLLTATLLATTLLAACLLTAALLATTLLTACLLTATLLTAALLATGLLAASLLTRCSALALLGLAGPALSVLSLPFLPAGLLSVFALLVGPHGCVCAIGALAPVIAPSFLLWLLLPLSALVAAPFLLLLLISWLGLLLFSCGFTCHFVLSFHYLALCCAENAGVAIG